MDNRRTTAAALQTKMAVSSSLGSISVLAPLMSLSADVVDKIHGMGNINSSLMAPVIIEDIVNSPERERLVIQALIFLCSQ